MTTWFTSDPHFFHNNVIRYCDRPFSSVEEMNEALIRNWNEVVRPGDTVICLGDFSLAFRPVELFSARLMGDKFLVPGNHDFCHSYNKKSRSPENREKWIAKYEEHGWHVLPEQEHINIGGHWVKLCHHPYADGPIEDMEERLRREGQTYTDKYAKWRPKDEGGWLLCGHIHQNWKTRGKMINVGVDVWDFKPVNIAEIEKIIISGS